MVAPYNHFDLLFLVFLILCSPFEINLIGCFEISNLCYQESHNQVFDILWFPKNEHHELPLFVISNE